MRYPRIVPDPEVTPACYHLITKTVNGEFLFHDAEKHRLQRHLWLVAERCGIEVITYELMTNHLHIVALAPKREVLPDNELLRRYALLHPGHAEWEAEHLEYLGRMLVANGDQAIAWRRSEQRKASNISEFMKLLKQRYSLWFNRNHDRFGTLWYERFKSVLLEPGRAVRRCMAYVNTNAARARICRDPTVYRFNAYSEAIAGSPKARAGIMRGLGATTWAEAMRIYRRLLLARAARPVKADAVEFESANTEGDEEPSDQRPAAAQLRWRCRCFSDGAVLGSKAFVEEHLRQFRERTGLGQRMRTWSSPNLGSGLLVMKKLGGARALA